MKYDFTTIIDRHGKDALAVDMIPYTGVSVREGVEAIPMWVADMNFATCPTIQEAIAKRLEHPCFGYFRPTEEYYDAIIHWQEERNGVTGLKPVHIGYENGVLGGVISALNTMCSRGDRVLLQSPTYVGFTEVLRNNGYQIIHNPMVLDEEGIWRIDFEDMEERLIKEEIHAAIFCSPHNPCGRVWERWEIEQYMELCRKHDVYVISDEIWSDLILPGYKHIPTQSVSEDARMRTIAMYAPSKTFNLAGLVGSYHIVYNTRLRHRLMKESSLSHYNMVNVLSMHALIGAYCADGAAWVNEVCQVIDENVICVCEFFHKYFPEIQFSRPQGTYMLFIDCTKWCEKNGKTIDEVQRAGVEAGVIWQDGRQFQGECHIRLNLALPHSKIQEALERMKNEVFISVGERLPLL